jgi:hypothetical protein
MSRISELQAVSEAMTAAARAGRWDGVSRNLFRRADVLDGLEGVGRDELAAALRAGKEVQAALRGLLAELETELQNLRAARRAARVWRPYREASGGVLDLSS